MAFRAEVAGNSNLRLGEPSLQVARTRKSTTYRSHVTWSEPGVSVTVLDGSWDCLASHLGRARKLSPPPGLLVVVLGLAAFRRDEFGQLELVRRGPAGPRRLLALLEVLLGLDLLPAPLDGCLLYTSPSPRDRTRSRMPSSA